MNHLLTLLFFGSLLFGCLAFTCLYCLIYEEHKRVERFLQDFRLQRARLNDIDLQATKLCNSLDLTQAELLKLRHEINQPKTARRAVPRYDSQEQKVSR